MATGDNIIEVGAVIDLSQILPGLQELVAQVQATTTEMRASLETLDAPVKVGAIAPTPEAAGVTPAAIEALSNVTLDLTLKQEVLKASVEDMVAEIAKEGGTTEVTTSWTKRLAEEELALGLVDKTVAGAERTLAESRGILIDQSQLALLIQKQLTEELNRQALAAVNNAAALEKLAAKVPITAVGGVAPPVAAVAPPPRAVSSLGDDPKKREAEEDALTAALKRQEVAYAELVKARAARGTGPRTEAEVAAEKELEAAIKQTRIAQEGSTVATTAKSAAMSSIVGSTTAAVSVTDSLTVANKRLEAATVALEAIQVKHQEAQLLYTQAGPAISRETQLTEAQIAAEQELEAVESRLLAAETEEIAAREAVAAATVSETAANTSVVDSSSAAVAAAVDQTTANAGVVSSSEAVAGAAAAQAAAVTVTGTVSVAAAAQAKLVNDNAKELAVSLMATGKSADQAAQMMMQAGISSEKVNSTFVELGKPLKVIQTETGAASAATQQMILAQKAAGASSAELARTMQLAGLSGREIAAQLQGLGFTANEVSQTMAQLGIKITGARNETLRMAADAGATREQLQALNVTIQEVAQSTRGMANGFGIARLEMGALDGSTGMMAGGLARIAATSKLLGPIMQAAFPLFAAYALVTILAQMYEGFKKLSDEVMGYTEEVKKSEQATIKASQAAEVHSASVQDAYRKMGRTITDQAEIAGKSWSDQAQKGFEEAQRQQSAWTQLFGPLSSVYNLYIFMSGALNGLTDATNKAAKAQEMLAQHHAELNKQLAERDKNNLKILAGEQSVANVGSTRVDQIEKEIESLGKKEELEKNIAGAEAAQRIIAGTAGEGEQFTARQRVADEFALKRLELTKKLGVAELEERIAQEKAVTDAEKTYGLARITQAERFAQEMYAAGKINLDKEVSTLEASEIQKFNLEKSNLDKRKAIAESERGAGKDPTAQIETINGELRTLAVNHETALTAIKSNGTEQRKRFDEEYARAVITGETKISNETVVARKDALKVLFEDGTLSEATYTKMLISNEQQRTDVVNTELKKQRDLINTYTRPDEKVTKLKEADDAEAVEVQRHEANLEVIKAASQKRVNADERKTVEEKLSLENTTATESVRVAERSADEQIRQVDRLQSYGAISVRERARQNIELIDSENQVTLAILNTAIAQEEDAKAAAKSAGAQEAAEKKILELKKERVRLEDEIAAKQKKVVDDLLNYEIQKNQQAYAIIGNSLASSLDRMTHEHIAFSQVMVGFWNQMVQGWAKMGFEILAHYVQTLAQILIQEALTALKINIIHANSTTIKKATETLWDGFLNILGIKRSAGAAAETTKDVATTTTGEAAKTAAVTAGVAARTAAETTGAGAAAAAVITSNDIQIISDAGLAGAAGFASVMEALPFPANVAAAPGVAATAIGAVLANLTLASAATGTDVAKAQPMLVHAGEVITDTPSLNLLNTATKPVEMGAAAASALNVTNDQILMLQAGQVVVPKAQAAGLASIFLQGGASPATATGEPAPFGIKEIPQRLSTSTSTMISQIIERATSHTTEGGAKISSARDGFSIERTVSSARDGFTNNSHELVKSAREGFTAPMVLTAAQGAFLEKDSLVAAHKNETVLPPPLSLGLKNIIAAGAFQAPSLATPAVPTALQSPPEAGGGSSSSTTNNYKTVNVRPQITVHQSGGASDRMSHEQIASAVKIGIRKGLM